LLLLLFIAGCAKEIRAAGIIIDEQTGLPVKEAKVRMIVNIVNNKMEMAEAVTSRDGRFELQFETFRNLLDQLPVELSKPGYQTNMYNLRKDSQSDTLALKPDSF